MIRISILIPTLNEEQALPVLLQQLDSVPECEILIADGGSTDRTIETARPFDVQLFEQSGGRARQLNEAARRATGEVLLFLHADTQPPPDFPAIIAETLLRPGIVAGAFRLGIEGEGFGFRLIEAVTNIRSTLLQTPYGDQGIFLRAEDFHRIGGFPEIPIMEDFVLVRTLARSGRIALTAEKVLTSARRWQRLGLWRTTLTNWGMVIGYKLGVSPNRLAGWYRNQRGRS